MSATQPHRKSPFVPTTEDAKPLTGSLPLVPLSQVPEEPTHNPDLCWCGCGEQTGPKAYYRPGHDSRHVGQVARQVAASDEFNSITEQLPTKALQLKAWNMAYRLHVQASKPKGRRRAS
jgi:hypothetical protein